MAGDSKSGSARQPGFLVGALLVALVGSNLWWLYLMVDAGVTQGYTQVSLVEHAEALDQALAALPIAARSGSTRDEILAAARPPGDPEGKLEFEKDGFVWIGRLGLRFDANGRLVAARKNWEPDPATPLAGAKREAD